MAFFQSASWKGKSGSASDLPKCGQCGLWKGCQSPKMEPTGRGKHSILFVGEAPGRQEDEQGRQFVGESGQLLRDVLEELDFNLDDAWITNAAICRPPKNEIEDLHIESCRPTLAGTVAKLRPRVIVLLGLSPVKSLLAPEWGPKVGAAGRWVGWNIPSHSRGAWVCPTYHPAYVLRQEREPQLRLIMKEHLRRAIELQDTPLPRPDIPQHPEGDDLKNLVRVYEDPAEGEVAMRKLVGAEGYLAFDYETTGLKPEAEGHDLHSVSFCLNGKRPFATALNRQAWGTLSAVLRNKRTKKIASNMKFEERWTRRLLGHGVENWFWDTMLGAHVLDNRPKIASIKFQGFVHLGAGEYNAWVKPYLTADHANDINRIYKAPLKDILLYCGIDSFLEYRVAEIQTALMGVTME